MGQVGQRTLSVIPGKNCWGKMKQAGTGPSRRHIQGSTSCEVWGKIDNAIREKKTLYPNFETLYRN